MIGPLVLVTGGRNYQDAESVYQWLDRAYKKHPNMWVLQGGANGADALAAQWAKARQVPYITMPAEWDRLGRAAGPERNARMAALPGVIGCLAFPGGRGTGNMVKLCEERGIPVTRCGW